MPSTAQDLVANPSFDLAAGRTTAYGQIEKSEGWMNGNGGSVDLYSENASKCRPQVGVPANGQGEQTAFNGGSYAGFIAYRDEPVLRGLPEGIGGPLTTYESGYLEYSEYLTTELTAPLIAGKAYRITYQVSLSDKSELAVNHLGAYVSVESPDQVSNKFMDVSPSFKTSLVSSDKEGWTSISGTFTASGGRST